MALVFSSSLLVMNWSSAADKEEGRAVVKDADETPSFRLTIQPMLNTSCVSCHMNGTASANLNLQPGKSYQALVGVKSTGSTLDLVKPGDPEASYLMHKLLGTHTSVGGSGGAMPLGSPRAEEDLIVEIRKWIESGATDD